MKPGSSWHCRHSGSGCPGFRAVCEDVALLGVPFYVMDYIDGFVVTDVLPPGLDGDASARRRLSEDLVDTLVEIHGADVSAPALAPLVRPGSYLERQVRRFSQLWEVNATRELPLVGEVGAKLAAAMPPPLAPVVVHGDYRLGNMIVAAGQAGRIVAVLDWEMGAVGDPRADVGYLLATYTEPNGAPTPLGTSPVTATPGFSTRAELAARYISAAAVTSSRSIGSRHWHCGKRRCSARRYTAVSSGAS